MLSVFLFLFLAQMAIFQIVQIANTILKIILQQIDFQNGVSEP